MRFVLGAVLALGLAALLGLGATWWTVANGLPVGRLVIGVWKAEPDSGTLSADPYEIATTVRSGEAPLAYGDGLAFTARADEAGRTLDAACDYELSGEMPPVRLWTLSAFRPDGARVAADQAARSTSSANVVRRAGSPLAISLSRHARPGNWAELPADGPFVLRLTLYDTTLGTPLERANPTALPSLRRGSCG